MSPPCAHILRRVALGAAAIAAVWCMAFLLTGGFALRIGPLVVRSHRLTDVLATLAIATIAALALGGRRAVAADFRQSWDSIDRVAAGIAAAASVGAFAIGVHWGTFTAGGSDSYCYVSQAALFANGRVALDQPLARQVPWEHGAESLVPSGYVAAADPAVIVPKCPPGLAILMTGAMRVAGADAVYYVVPVLGAAAVFLTFLLGQQLGRRIVGAVASLVLMASPIFVFQIVQPMSDVPATAWWLAAIVLAHRGTPLAAFGAGLAASVAILTRPNLAPLAIIIGAFFASALRIRNSKFEMRNGSTRLSLRLPFRIPHSEFRIGILYAAGLIPGIAATLAFNAAMHGSPLRSGYGDLGQIFSIANALPNLTRYSRSLIETQTPVVLLAFAAPIILWCNEERRWRAIVLLMFVAAVWGAYLWYQPFEEWWYLRFMLPALPAMVILTAVSIIFLIERLPAAVRTPALVIGLALLVGWTLRVADTRLAFDLRQLERRYLVTGEHIARQLPPTAVVFAVHQSGSIRHYSGRTTIAWDAIAPPALDGAIRFLTERGEPPYLLLETWEEPAFRDRFAGSSLYGTLDWPPQALIGRDVRLYDLAARARYRAGEQVRPTRVPVDSK
jgi:hypothetical protein